MLLTALLKTNRGCGDADEDGGDGDADEDGVVGDISGDALVVTLACGCAVRRLQRLAEADCPACGLITSAPACPTLSHTTTLVGTTQLQKFDTASTRTCTFERRGDGGE